MIGGMSERESRPEAPDHERCRHVVREAGSDEPVRYCRNPTGVFVLLDCPVFQGGACRFFDPLAEGHAPPVTDAAGLAEVRAELAEDYLRWRYRRRVEALRRVRSPTAGEE